MLVVKKDKIIGTCIRKNVRCHRVLTSTGVAYAPVDDTRVVDYTVGASKFRNPVPQPGRDKVFWNRIPLQPVVLQEDNIIFEYDRGSISRHKVPAGSEVGTVHFGSPDYAGTVWVILPKQS